MINFKKILAMFDPNAMMLDSRMRRNVIDEDIDPIDVIVGRQGNNMPEVTVTEPSLLIRIAQLYRDGMSAEDLYEATRGVWRLGERREVARYALAIAAGVVREVYQIHRWHPAGSTPYRTRPMRDVNVPGRWEFTGAVAPGPIRSKYVGKSVAHYFKKGCVAPVSYVGV